MNQITLNSSGEVQLNQIDKQIGGVQRVPMQALKSARFLKRGLWTAVRRSLFFLAYRLSAICSVNPTKVVFIAARKNVVPMAFRDAYSYLLTSFNLDVAYYVLTRGSKSNGEYVRHCVSLGQELATARVVFVESMPPVLMHLSLRDETTLIELRQDGDASQHSAVNASTLSFYTDGAQDMCQRIMPDLDNFPKVPIERKLRERNLYGIDISFVIPAYNAASTLSRAIDSVLSQPYDLKRIEVIVVDDNSSDGTWSIVQDYEARFPGLVRSARTPQQSGTPALPRNTGLEMAHGEYVFFLDADDWIGEKAVPLMLERAVEWNSDVLVVKIIGEGGREAPKSMFEWSHPQVDVFTSKVVWTLGPYKLFRRSLVQDIRFPDFMPEDMSFVIRAYAKANVVSVAADHDYYHLSAQVGEKNASVTSWVDVETNLKAYEDIFGFIGETLPEKECNQILLRRVLRRDVCNTLTTIGQNPDHECACSQLQRLMGIVGPYVDLENLGEASEREIGLLAAAFAPD